MAREVTNIVVAEDGTESHESWLSIGASKVQSSGERLFDSEITHHHYVIVTISRCTRQRTLNRDWKHATQTLMEFAVSHAQWGAFVSSFGDGNGVPATLFRDHSGLVPQAPAESRLGESAHEVHEAGNKSLAGINESYAAMEEAFERGAGKREMRELIRDLKYRIANAPANMKFAATSLTEHVENVVTKARADFEAMAIPAAHDNPFLQSAERVETQALDVGSEDR